MWGIFSLSGNVFGSIIRQAMIHPSVKTAIGVDESSISDENFIEQLRDVRKLRRFLFSEMVKISHTEASSTDLGILSNLKYHRYGRKPDEREWELLDVKMSILADYLTPELRRKFKIWELGLYFGLLPICFLVLGVTALAVAFFFPKPFTDPTDNMSSWQQAPLFISVVAWTISLGGLGACAFLTTTLLAGQNSISPRIGRTRDSDHEYIDITDTNFVNARLVIGILFSFLLGLPFSSASLRFVLDKMYEGTKNLDFSTEELAMMVIPFVMGFSTNLVLLILERIVTAIKSVFGISGPK